MTKIQPNLVRLGLWEYERSIQVRLATGGMPFYSIVAHLIRVADTENTELIKACWPNIYADFVAR